MGVMTFLEGTICTLDGKPFGKIEEVREVEEVRDEIAAKLDLPRDILFECHSFDINYDPWLAKMFGVWRRKKARPERKRLLARLKNRYGWYRTAEYSLTPCGDGKFKCVMNAGTLEVTV